MFHVKQSGSAAEGQETGKKNVSRETFRGRPRKTPVFHVKHSVRKTKSCVRKRKETLSVANP